MTTVGDWRVSAIMRKLRKLRGRSAAELRERIGQALAAELEVRGFSASVGEPSKTKFWSQSVARGMLSATNATELREHFAHRNSPAFFAGIRDGSSAAELNRARWSDERAELTVAADKVVAGTFDLLGYPNLSFGQPLDWHFDPINQRRAPRQHWSRIPYLDASVVGDHKVIWEINRHQHFLILGRAFQVSGNPVYAECFASHVTSWMNENPPKNGVNWASSLEVAYRAISWVWAIEFFRGSASLTGELLQRMLSYLIVHAEHLARYLSTYFSPNTHLTGEALGLFYLGTMFPELNRANDWKKLAWDILDTQITHQILNDGVYFEQASYYHRYTIDIYLHAILLARANGNDVSPRMEDRLRLGVAHLADLTRANGTIPVIGDDDGGRLVQLERQSFTDVRAALDVAAVVLKCPEYAAVARGATEEVLWLLGTAGVANVDSYVHAALPQHTSTIARTGGYAIMRDQWGPRSSQAVIDGGPLGDRNCGHAHSDALSIDLSVAGIPILVDPGAYTYTGSAEDRDAFRHSAAHNTVTVDGMSASTPAGPFTWASRADAVIDSWWSGNLVDRFVGSHPGFERLADPVTHHREVLYVRGAYWVIVDTIHARGTHDSSSHFHISPQLSLNRISPTSAWLTPTLPGAGVRVFFFATATGDAIQWGDGWVSNAYGSRVKAPYARASVHGTGPQQIVSVVIPCIETENVTVATAGVELGRTVVVNRRGMRDVLLFGARRAEDGSAVLVGDTALVRWANDEEKPVALAAFGRDATVTAGSVILSVKSGAEAVRDEHGWNTHGDGQVNDDSSQSDAR